MKLTVLPSTLAVVLPLAIAVVLNALVRPWLADMLGGEMVRSGNAVRGPDRWWTFDTATQADHPIATTFLGVSDGAIAMASFAMIALALVGLWVARRMRS